MQAVNFAVTTVPSRTGYVSSSSSVPRRRSSASSRMVNKGMASINTSRTSIKTTCQRFSMMLKPKPNVTK